MVPGRIVDIVSDLALRHLWPRKTVVTQVVEKAVPLTRVEAVKFAADLTRKMNAEGTDAIKGIGVQAPKPKRATEEELLNVAKADLSNDKLASEVAQRIGQHRHHGISHSATAREQQILVNLRDAHIKAGSSWETIAQAIEAKRDEMSSWTPARSLRETYPDLIAQAENERGRK